MYTHENYTCEKGGEGEFARTPAETVPAEKEVRENSHVRPWKPYMRKRRWVQTRMYTYGNCTCGKGGDGEFACTSTGTVPAEKGGERKLACTSVGIVPVEKEVMENLHVHPRK